MSAVAETVILIFGLVALGYGSAISGLLRVETGDALSEFAVTIAVPMLLFHTMAHADFGGSLPLALWLAYFGAVVVNWTIGHKVVRRFFGRDARAGVVAGLASSFSNMVLFGIPFMQGIYGHRGVAIMSLIVAVHLPIMMAASIVLFEWARVADGVAEKRASVHEMVRDFFAKLFVNPLIIGILAGLAWRITGWSLPAVAARFVDTIAGIAGPVALFAMGTGLKKFGISGNVAPALATSVLKLAVLPALVLALSLLIGLPHYTATIAVVASSLPCGVNPYLIATRFGTGQALASNTLSISTLAAALTTSFWLFAASAIFGTHILSGP
ncbi:MAG: AEC family transporter [Brucellaceae bacterium]|nr:AEC family transporter [Brucellaceae bacterium]